LKNPTSFDKIYFKQAHSSSYLDTVKISFQKKVWYF